MKKAKLLALIFGIFFVVDVIHYFLLRMNPKYPDITEAFYETNQTTFIKWGLCALGIIGLMLVRNSKAGFYLLILISIVMIWLFITAGPLNHLLLWYSAVSLWILGILGVYLFFLSSKKILHKY